MTIAEAREICRRLFLEALDSLKLAPRMRDRISVRGGILKVHLDPFPPTRFQTVRVIAFGKAAVEMARTAADPLETAEADVRGVVVGPSPDSPQLAPSLPGLQYLQADHPYPDERSLRAAEAVLRCLENCSAQDLVLFLISGGGSALIERPLDPTISMPEMREFHRLLVTCGANIEEMNILRKHFSAVKGGRLAQRAFPARQVTFLVSDVPEHLPSAVASGPTMPDESTVDDCRRIVAAYDLIDKLPGSIRALLESGQVPETPKPGDACFAQSSYDCLLSNRDGVDKLLELARGAGIHAGADMSCDDWHFQRAADHLLGRLEAVRQQHPGEPVLLVSGGELSCPVPLGAKGRGGRNQAFVLDCVPKIAGERVTVLSAATDGIDGNSPATGAIADGETADRAAALGLRPEEFLARADSYSFFERLNDAIVTGPTGTNVRDLRILLAYA